MNSIVGAKGERNENAWKTKRIDSLSTKMPTPELGAIHSSEQRRRRKKNIFEENGAADGIAHDPWDLAPGTVKWCQPSVRWLVETSFFFIRNSLCDRFCVYLLLFYRFITFSVHTRKNWKKNGDVESRERTHTPLRHFLHNATTTAAVVALFLFCTSVSRRFLFLWSVRVIWCIIYRAGNFSPLGFYEFLLG